MASFGLGRLHSLRSNLRPFLNPRTLPRRLWPSPLPPRLLNAIQERVYIIGLATEFSEHAPPNGSRSFSPADTMDDDASASTQRFNYRSNGAMRSSWRSRCGKSTSNGALIVAFTDGQDTLSWVTER